MVSTIERLLEVSPSLEVASSAQFCAVTGTPLPVRGASSTISDMSVASYQIPIDAGADFQCCKVGVRRGEMCMVGMDDVTRWHVAPVIIIHRLLRPPIGRLMVRGHPAG
jgi:hypothetical protein